MKKLMIAFIFILSVLSTAGAADRDTGQALAKKVQAILPAGWTVTVKADGIKMYERAATSLEIKDSAKVPGFMLTVTDTNAKVAKDAQHPVDYNPYFEVYFYNLPLTEEQVIKYNRLANAQYNRPAGSQEEYPPRYAFRKGVYVVMKTPSWGKSASPDIDTLMLKTMSLARKELP